jgi:hypothetical protein
MTGLDLAVGEELSSSFEPCLTFLIRIVEHPPRADNRLSKINTDYETSLYAAMASFIIHIYF